MTDDPLREDGPGSWRNPCSTTTERHVNAVPFRDRLSCTVDEACEVTGLGRTKLYELIGSGRVLTTTIGRRRLVIIRSLLELVETTMSE